MVFQLSSHSHGYVAVFIIISVLVCPHTYGSRRNQSSNEPSTYTFTPSDYTNKSYFIQHPGPKCEERTSPKYIALATFSAVVMFLGIIGNAMVILVIQYSQLRKQSGYVLVSSLAAADLGVSLFVTTTKVHLYKRNRNFCYSRGLCIFYLVADGLFPTASITHLLFICINKFFAVYSPYYYHSLVTYPREIVVVLCVWFYCLLWTAAGMVTWDSNPMFSLDVITFGINRLCYNYNSVFYVSAAIFVFIIPGIVIGSLYVRLFSILAEKTHATSNIIGTKIARVKNSEASQMRSVKVNNGNKKGAKTLIIVFAGWVICWMPHFSLILINYWSPFSIDSFAKDNKCFSDLIGTVLSDVLPCINSFINPFIYFKTSSIFQYSLNDSYLKLMKLPRHRLGSTRLRRGESLKSPSLDTIVKYGVLTEAVTFMQLHSRTMDTALKRRVDNSYSSLLYRQPYYASH